MIICRTRPPTGLIAILVVSIVLAACGGGEEQSPGAEAATDDQPPPESIPGLRKRAFGAEDFRLMDAVAAADGLAAREFSYRSDGVLVYGLIEHPAGPVPEGGWPVIVVAHGYIPPEQWSTVDNYRLVTRYLASGGFLVVKPDYRYHGRSEGSQEDSLTPTINYSIDVMNIVASLDDIPGADTGNVFLWGHSMGGEVGLRILTVNDALKGASLWAGVTKDYPENTLYFIRKRSPDLADYYQELVDEAYSAEVLPTLSPGNYLGDISVPILVHHGTEDEIVPFEWTVPFRAALDSAGADYTFYEYADEDHNISRSFYRVMDRDMDLFRSLLD